jgi:hypothetical protein
VQCCSVEADFAIIDQCVGGTSVLARPAACAPAATCILGFGPDGAFIDDLCGGATSVPFTNGFCSSWSEGSIPVVHQCVAIPSASVTMFEVWDDEQDGDLDAADMAVFDEVYAGVPKLDQTHAQLTGVECCIPDAVISAVAACLSGPNQTSPPPSCSIESYCTAGFSAPLEPGDWLYRTCLQSPTEPEPEFLHCDSWTSGLSPAVFECRTVPFAGHSLFNLIDSDGDQDADLLDYAALQRAIAESGR